MGVVWFPRGSCWPGSLPRVLAPLQGRQRCIPCPVGVPGLRVAPCAPLDHTQSPFPAGLLSPGWLALRWALTAVCLLVLGDHPTLSILLGCRSLWPLLFLQECKAGGQSFRPLPLILRDEPGSLSGEGD